MNPDTTKWFLTTVVATLLAQNARRIIGATLQLGAAANPYAKAGLIAVGLASYAASYFKKAIS